jgi:hypothetical protein
LDDPAIPEEYRQPFISRRRARELLRAPVLALSAKTLAEVASPNRMISTNAAFSLLSTKCFTYENANEKDQDLVLIWSFVTVWREREVLSYRLGRYRDDRDMFMSKQSIGLSTLVPSNAQTLFSLDDLGIVDAGVTATRADLDIPEVSSSKGGFDEHAQIEGFLWTSSQPGTSELLAIVKFRCPDWFEPIKRRLALNDLRWLDLSTPPNNIDDFDPWSRSVIENFSLV